MSKKNENKEVQCDECGYVWKKLKHIKHKEQSIEINNRQVVLHYFMCPKCKKVYVEFVEGPRYKRFVSRLDKARNKLWKATSEDEAKIILLEVLKYQQELEKYVSSYNKMFSGTFIVNNQNDVNYLP